MDKFIDLVETCRKKRVARDIYNASIEHAKVLFQNLFKVAAEDKKDVRIVSANLDNNFYSNLVTNADDVFNNGGKIFLIILNPEVNVDDNKFAKTIRDNKSGELIHVTNEGVNFPHFILVGKDHYRIETDHLQTKAVANFNNPDVGGVLFDFFEKFRKEISPSVV